MADTVKVKPGDNMSALAAKAGVSLAAMKAANPQIANPSLIKPGQVLNVPAPKAAAPAATPAPKVTAPVAPTSGVIPGFTPSVTMPTPAIKPGEPGFVGPVAPKSTTSTTDSASSVGPQGGLGAGVVAGVTGAGTGTGTDTGTGTGWIKSGTVQTEDGPVDVDANGLAKDGSKPTPKPERTMAIDTFRRTLATFFGEKEVANGWVDVLYKVTSGYYKTGSTVDESLNLALKDARNNPDLAPFAKRFKGVYALQDKALAGEAIEVPTIAEFYKSQFALGEVMTRAGFPDLATNEFLGDVLGTGKSVAETTALINDVFAAIDNAPAALKKDLETIAPGADRTAIARALLMGKQGAAALTKQIAETTVLSAAKSQGLTIAKALAADYAARGFGYDTSLAQFGNVALGRGPLEKLLEISTGKAVTPEEAQTTMQQSLFEKNVAAQEQIRLEAEKEAARYGGRSGAAGSRSLASRNRADRAI